jgi:branched-chain amino acid transport system permease protein
MPTSVQSAYALQQVFNAAPLAALYALLAFGYSLTFGLTRRVDFTPGALFAFAGQIVLMFTSFGYGPLVLVYPAALALGATAALAYGLMAGSLVAEKVIRPLAFASPNAVIVASLAMMIVLMELARLAVDNRQLWLSPFLNGHIVVWPLPDFPVIVTQIQLVNTAVMGFLVAAAALLLARSALGRRWRAVCDDEGAARLVGIDAGRVVVAASLATALFSALGGVLATAYYGSMDFGSGLMFGLKVVMISAIGDQSSPWKSAVGAALFGLVETLWGAYLSYEWRDLAMVSLLVGLAVLIRGETR